MNARLRFVVLTVGAILALATTLSLGRWQLDRAAQKQAMQVALEVEGRKPEVDTAVFLAAPDKSVLVNQRAVLQGTWVTDKTIFLDNRQMDSKVGFFVVTPLRLANSAEVILVQRGWIQRNFEARTALMQVETPAGLVTLEGRIAPPASKLYEPGAPSVTAIRQNLDLVQLRAETGLPLAPVMLLQTGAASEGLLRRWPTVDLGIEKHYGYAFQWFGIAALVAGLYLWFQILQPFFQRTKDSNPHV